MTLPPNSIYRRHILIPRSDGNSGRNPNFNNNSIDENHCFTLTNQYEDIWQNDILSKY